MHFVLLWGRDGAWVTMNQRAGVLDTREDRRNAVVGVEEGAVHCMMRLERVTGLDAVQDVLLRMVRDEETVVTVGAGHGMHSGVNDRGEGSDSDMVGTGLGSDVSGVEDAGHMAWHGGAVSVSVGASLYNGLSFMHATLCGKNGRQHASGAEGEGEETSRCSPG